MENQSYPPKLKAILQEAFKGVGVLCTEQNKGIILKQAIEKRDFIITEFEASPKPKPETHKFKALMHDGEFVDYQLLEVGIKKLQTPFIYPESTTMESLVDFAKNGLRFYSPESLSAFIENLEKCELVEVELTIKTK